jgi:glycerate kinase
VSVVLVAPDKFKGTLTASEVAAAIAAGLRDAGHEAIELPVADGGEGTAAALGAKPVQVTAADPLGRPVEAEFGLLEDGQIAVVEAASASGLWRLAQDELDAAAATSAGTGELISAAVEAGAQHVIVACGGTATVDGGKGLLGALGAARKGYVPVSFTAVCDVRTAWEEAASTFGPQKGADAATIARLRRRLAALARSMRDRKSVV